LHKKNKKKNPTNSFQSFVDLGFRKIQSLDFIDFWQRKPTKNHYHLNIIS